MGSGLSIVRCSDYDPSRVLDAVKRSIELIGGIEQYIKPKSKVLVKPNLLMAKEPDFAVTTHPEVTRAVIRLLKNINCEVVVGDGPSVWGRQVENVDAVYETTGTKAVCLEEGVRLVEFDRRRMREKFPLTACLDECDFLVSIPKFKTHQLALLTGAVKNLFGLVSGTFKTEIHKNYFNRDDFAQILVDIYAEARPALTIVDGILAMEGDGPGTSGKPRQVNLLLAGNNCVDLDSVLALIMGINPQDVLSTKEAIRRGLGQSDVSKIDISGEKLEDVIGEPFLLPSSSMAKKIVPEPIIKLAKKLIRYYPCVEQDNCIKCAACIKSCPTRAVSFKKEKITFDYAKCIACFCCQETCPNSAIRIKKSWFAKMIGL